MLPLKLFLRYPHDALLARKILANKQARPDQFASRPVLFDLRTANLMFDGGRHLYTICHYLAENRSPTVLRCGKLLLSGIAHKSFGSMMLQAPHVEYLNQQAKIPTGAFVLGDYRPCDREFNEVKLAGSHYMRMNIGREIASQTPVMPYPMHPYTLPYATETTLSALRSLRTRDCLILFAGSQKRRYGAAWMEEQFGVLSRLSVLNTVRHRFPEFVTEDPFPSDFRPEALGESNQIRILDGARHLIAARDWLPTIARSHFFLCGPGGRQPLCHHLIEAMSVGTIPILEYGNRISPPLTDGLNAICFKGQKGLVEAIERVQGMDQEQLANLRDHVISFYEKHLCGTRFWKQILADQIDGQEIAMPFHEKNLE